MEDFQTLILNLNFQKLNVTNSIKKFQSTEDFQTSILHLNFKIKFKKYYVFKILDAESKDFKTSILNVQLQK